MLIDGFTVIVQIINFLVLVALLKFFLYTPILKAMDERTRRIANRLEAAEAERRDAKREAESFRRKNTDWTRQKEALFAEAVQTADTEKRKMIQEARAEVNEIRTRWQASVAQQKKDFLEDLRHRVVHQVYATARRALRDLANRDLETQMFSALVTHLEGISAKEWKSFTKGMVNQNAEMTIESAFEISPKQRAQMTRLLHDRLSKNIHLVFETRADAVCGITIKLPGKKMAWNLDDYLKALEEEIKKAVESVQEAQVQEKPEADVKLYESLKS